MTAQSTDAHGTQADSFRVVAIAASAGGLRALLTVLGELPETFPVPVLVVQHLDPRHDTALADILGRRTELTVKLARHGEQASPGVVYVAPPDRHLLVDAGGHLALTDSEPVHFVRPAADLLFDSVAGSYGACAIACVLTGTGTDGASGVIAVKASGGTIMVQNPATAEFKGMPEAAVATGEADFVLDLDQIASAVTDLVNAGRPR